MQVDEIIPIYKSIVELNLDHIQLFSNNPFSLANKQLEKQIPLSEAQEAALSDCLEYLNTLYLLMKKDRCADYTSFGFCYKLFLERAGVPAQHEDWVWTKSILFASYLIVLTAYSANLLFSLVPTEDYITKIASYEAVFTKS